MLKGLKKLFTRSNPSSGGEEIDSVKNIPDFETWEKLSYAPLDATFANTRVAKVVISLLKDKPEFHFLNSNRWWFHVDYISRFLVNAVNGAMILHNFNHVQYCTDRRSFILGSLIHYGDADVYTFELWPGDNLSTARLIPIFQKVQSLVCFGERLKYRPASDLHYRMLREYGEHHLPIVESDVIFGGTKYQPLTEGTVIGRVHIVLGNEVDATLEITPDTILICELVPNDIPIVAALVTSQLQTPLCHVALLSQNRKSPNIAVRDIIMDDAVLALDGKPARLTANLQTWSLEAVSESELEAWTAERKRSVTVVQQPMVSTSVKRLIDITAEAKALADSRGELAANVGAKAQQIALVESSAVRKDRPRVKILEAFAVPFHYFCEHFARSGGDKLLAAIETERAETVQVDPLTSSAALRDSLTASAMFRAANSSYDEGTQSRNVRESGFDSILRMSGQVAPEIAAIELAPLLTEQLQRVRDAIIAAPINDELVAAIRAQIAAWRRTGVLGERQGVIFRSSTNVEDLPGFNGAGLYLSEPVSASDLDDAHAIESAIKRVWASLFDAAGYKERAFFGIEQQKVAMALLVQPFLDGELVHCNGVAVTRNPFRKDFPGYYLNVQLGAEHRVTDAATGHTPEQVLIYNDGGQPTPDILSLSSLTNGERVLTPDDIPALFGVFRYLANKWHRTLNNFLIAVDIEFLILKDEKRSIVVLQVRPI